MDEALHLSDREEHLLLTLMQQLNQEYSDRIDAFSQDVMISQLDLLLSHVNRFYNRQFLTRKKSNADQLAQLDAVLEDYFDSGKAYSEGYPAVGQLAKHLSGLVPYLFRSFNLVFCRKGERKWQTDTAKNSSVMRCALL
ncbi:hypothetical protein [Thalassobius sp. I31.1]|uniref:hypothetical protein n=1 Tax=Thalassobius sp. I31.1 TaxID=2109912 RepID=UPI001300684F|nr:hypothetical protein [Thalassobius sp. I31.1]